MGAVLIKLQRRMVTLVGIEPNVTRVKISYPKPLDDRAKFPDFGSLPVTFFISKIQPIMIGLG
jgi:hypothetical protein